MTTLIIWSECRLTSPYKDRFFIRAADITHPYKKRKGGAAAFWFSLPRRDFVQSCQRIWIPAYQKHQGRCLRIRLRSSLFPFFQRSFVNP